MIESSTEALSSSANDPARRNGSLPIFYRRPEALNPARHGDLRIVSRPGYEFARAAHALPIMAGEMPVAMRSYPIVFAGEARMPVVITGLTRNENLFVEAGGSWSEPHYVPAYVRRYPFVLAGDEKAERLTLCVDRDSERVVGTPSGEAQAEASSPLFDGKEPSEATKKALAFCEQYQASVAATRAIVAKVAEHGLFVDRRSKVTLPGGETLSLTDFQVIDEATLNKLDDQAFLELRAAGALPLIYCHLASMNSWSSLLHQAKKRTD